MGPMRVLFATTGGAGHFGPLVPFASACVRSGGPLAASVRVERWIDQPAVMRQAAVMVGHGGAGSVLGALAAGVPMALIPLFADQPLNARRIAELAAGVALEGGTTATPALAAVVPELVSNPGYH